MEDWGTLPQAFARTRPVVVVDHRGIGASYLTEGEDEEYTIEMMGHDVLALLRELKMTQVGLLGFSMGGLIAQAIVTDPEARPTSDQAGVEVHGVEVRALILTATFAKNPKSEFRIGNAYVPLLTQSVGRRDEPCETQPCPGRVHDRTAVP